MSLKTTFRSRSNSGSKSQQKDAKYISAAIIPSAAFIANPIVPSYSSDHRNSLLSNTLKSNESHEFNDKDEIIDEMKKVSSEYKNENFHYELSDVRDECTSNIQGYHEKASEIHNAFLSDDRKENGFIIVEKKKKHRKKRSVIKNHEDNKRHIEIANGLHVDQHYFPSKPTKNQAKEFDEFSLTESDHRNSMHNPPKTHALSSESLKSDAVNTREYAISEIILENIEEFPQDHKRIQKIGFETFENRSVTTNENQTSRLPDDMGYQLSESAVNRYEDQITTISNESQIQNNLLPKSNGIINRSSTDTRDIELDPPPIGFMVEDLTNKQMRSEIRLLQDTIYRLNMELSEKISTEEEGNYIGKTILPGKGPFPNWLMNTKYLAPLFLFHDKKLKEKCAQIQKMETQMKQFEKEIRQIIKENEKLHLKVQEKQKGGHLSNSYDWHVIAQQAKLVIEENRLLLEELDVQQQKFKLLEKDGSTEMAQLKKSLLSVTSERDALDEEIKHLTRKMAELKSEMQQKCQSSLNQVSEQQQIGSTNDIQFQFYVSQIDDMKKDNRRLEQEVEQLKENEKKQNVKLEKYKKVTEWEKKFRDYFNNILDKSDEVLNDRNSLVGSLEKQNTEIGRLVSKLTTDINCRTDIDMNEFEKYKCKKHKDDLHEDLLYTFELWIDILMENYVNLMEKCKTNEKDICNYQKLVNEKDRYLQECQQYNDQLEKKVENILQKQAHESF